MTKITTSKKHDDNLLISYLSLRKYLGVLGITLPFILVGGTIGLSDCTSIQNSISHYYHTEMRDVFVAIISCIAVFLISYQGYDGMDRAISNVAGISVLLVALFPTAIDPHSTCDIDCVTPNQLTNNFHLFSAVVFFFSSAVMSYNQFTKSKKGTVLSESKRKRNKIYRICGITMVVCLLLIAVYIHFENQLVTLEKYSPVFMLESVALVAFGTSWLVKGEAILKDRGE